MVANPILYTVYGEAAKVTRQGEPEAPRGYGPDFMIDRRRYSQRRIWMKKAFSIVILLGGLFCLSFAVRSQSPQQTLKPVDFVTKGTHVFLKAEMSPASPDDLKRRFMQWCAADAEYKDRQFIAKGASAKGLIAAAFRTGYDRLIIKTDLPETLYSAEIIVPTGCELMRDSLLQQTVLTGLRITAAREKVETEVGILKRNTLFKPDPVSQLAFRPSKEEKPGGTSWDTSSIKGTCEPVSVLANMLTAPRGIPILDETGLKGNYDFDIRWKEDSPGSLEMALEAIGLSLVTEKRLMDMLVIRPAIKPDK
jgi:uncharacterized protein (TIGR03435 family)